MTMRPVCGGFATIVLVATLVLSCGSSALEGTADGGGGATGGRDGAALGADQGFTGGPGGSGGSGGSGAGGGGAGGSGGSGGSGGGGTVLARCQRVCATAAPLNCGRAATCANDCVSDYEQLVAQAPQCRSQIEAVLTCGAGVPLSGWRCSAEGDPVLKDGHCPAEGMQLIQCVLGGA